MLGVRGISGENSLASYLVQVAASRSGATNDGDADDQKSSGPSAGGTRTGPADLKTTLISVLSDALKNASPSDSPADLLKLVQQTLAKTLKDNGVELSSTRNGAASKGDHSQATKMLLELLKSSGLSNPASNRIALLGSDTNVAGQQSLANLFQNVPAGFNFSAQA